MAVRTTYEERYVRKSLSEKIQVFTVISSKLE